MLNYICVYTITFLMPYYLIQGRGLNPAQAAAVTSDGLALRITRSANSSDPRTLRGWCVSGTSQQVMSYRVAVSLQRRGGFRNWLEAWNTSARGPSQSSKGSAE